jgi:capsular polysaccharide biosynthesis protein
MAAAIPPFHQTDERLPFDLRTMALSLLRHWYIAALSMIFGVALGFVGAYTLGSQTWRTETVLLYKPRLENLEGDPAYEAPPITTQMNLVKIRSNLEETRHLLNLDTKLEVLGKAVEVYVQDRTDLLTISVTWETARSAADIANTLRAVFMENQQRIRRTETDKTVDQLLRQAQIDRETLNRQMTNMSLQVETLQEQVKEERKTLNYRDVQRDMDIRSTQIREAISQDQNYRSRVAELTRAELDLERAQTPSRRNTTV